MTSEIGATAGLLGLWHMNEGSGTVVNDSSGSAINGTAVAAPTWTTGTTFTNAASERAHAQRDEPVRDDGRFPGSPLVHLHG